MRVWSLFLLTREWAGVVVVCVCGGGGTGREFITGSRSTDTGRTPDPQPLCAEPSYRETTVRTTAPPTFSSLFSHGRFAEHTHTWDIWQASAVYHREAATRKAGESFVLTWRLELPTVSWTHVYSPEPRCPFEPAAFHTNSGAWRFYSLMWSNFKIQYLSLLIIIAKHSHPQVVTLRPSRRIHTRKIPFHAEGLAYFA